MKRNSLKRLVKIFHQADPDFMEDQSTSGLVHVGSYSVDSDNDQAALRDAFQRSNAPRPGDEQIFHDPEERSTSVGDVVSVDGVAYQCQRNGWKRLDHFKP